MIITISDITNKESSLISNIKWDNKTLQIQFKTNNAIYEYYDVHIDHINEFLEAESIGRYFASHIKSKFEFKKIENKENQ